MIDTAELRKLIHKMQQDNAAGGIERFRDVRSFRYQDVEDLVNAAGSLLDDRDRLAAENARLRAALEEARPFVTPSVDLLLRKFNDIDGTDSKTREIIREIEEVRSRIDEALAPREERSDNG